MKYKQIVKMLKGSGQFESLDLINIVFAKQLDEGLVSCPKCGY